MENVPGQLKYHRTQYITQTLWADFFHRTDSRGHGHVGIRLEQRDPDGTGQVFKTDLDRLEAVAKRAEEFAASTERRETNLQTERIGNYTVTFVPWPTEGQGDRLAIHMEEIKPDGRQSFITDLNRLNATIKQGQRVEDELGFTDGWFHLVYGNSLKEENGQTKATVFKSVRSIEEARKVVWGNSSFALYDAPQRRPLEQGADAWLERDANLEFKGHRPRTVEDQLHNVMWHQERISENYVVASWNDVSREPVPGQRVFWEGGQTFNGEYAEIRARPSGLGEQGEPNAPTYVLLKLIPGKPFYGSVEAISTDRREVVDLHQELVREEKALAQYHEERHRMTTDQWREQSFGVDRNEHTRGFHP